MSYFSDNYSSLAYPIGTPGLRVAQAGAIHAIAAHFSISNEPALVVMPTGSGKTAVLLTAPYVLRANRVLIITPSQLVREQIAEGAKDLSVLKGAGVLPAAVESPRVYEVEGKMGTLDQWEKLRDFDFVVATPNCTSPEMDGVEAAPKDLFDVVLIDEAHHSAAKTWTALLSHFSSAKRILFTATPYRRDKKMISARSIYTYPLKKAFEDKIFGKVNFVPVEPSKALPSDVAIARKTEELFKQDRAAGLAHVVMVRTDSRKRAEELKGIYAEHTGLKLQLIHSKLSASFVKKAVEKLRLGTDSVGKTAPADALDGVICVNMMGEGFDFPFLKIAAVHTPHQSLAVTLQFIGRFARTTHPNIGEAHFVAIPGDIAGEAEELFHEGAIWNDIVPNLSEARVSHEQHVREVAASFTKVKVHREEDSDLEFDLGSITPFCHVKIYSVDEFAGLNEEPKLPGNFKIIQYDVSEEHQCSVALLKEEVMPRWTDYEELAKVEYDFVLTYYDETSKHLFICSSRRASLSLYDSVGDFFSNGTHKLLPLYEINRVLHDLKQPVLFQIGMKNSVTSSNSESYQTKMGSDLKGSVSDTDGKLNHRGHVYLRGEEAGKFVTIGYSSGSKVWSNSTVRVAEVILWCKNIAKKLTRKEKVVTGTTLDYLDVGEPITELPSDVVAVAWNDDVYKHSIEVLVQDMQPFQLHEASLEIVTRAPGKLGVQLKYEQFSGAFQIEVQKGQVVVIPTTDLSKVTVMRKAETFPLLTYLKEIHFHIYLSDFSRISANALFRSHAGGANTFSPDCLKTIDWKSHGVDITKEFVSGTNSGADDSIHGFLKSSLVATNASVVIYDHGTGEIGDFLTLEDVKDEIQFNVYHCKAAGGPSPGERVGDIYEVAGQVVKSLIWLRKSDDLLEKLRFRLKQGSEFLKGDQQTLKALFTQSRTKQMRFRLYCVQPGISATHLPSKLAAPMAAARDYVTRSCRGETYFLVSP